jgi:hypothetical protein
VKRFYLVVCLLICVNDSWVPEGGRNGEERKVDDRLSDTFWNAGYLEYLFDRERFEVN